MANKFADFLKSSKIDPRRVLIVSKKIEHLRPEDRAIRLARRNRVVDPAAPPVAEADKKQAVKPRSGRPVTPRLLRDASEGKAKLTGRQKTRLLRALNSILEQKGKEKIDLRALF